MINRSVVRGPRKSQLLYRFREQQQMYLPTDLFLQNKYHRWYYNIIESAKARGFLTRRQATEALGYVEDHHIYPKCLFPELVKVKSNLVFLTFKEHIICHLLLTKMAYGENRYRMYKSLEMISSVENIGDRSVYNIPTRWIEYAKNEGRTAVLEFWTPERRKAHSEKLLHYFKTVDKTTEKWKQVCEIQREYNTNKVWTEKAIETRANNMRKAAANRKGKPWEGKRKETGYVPLSPEMMLLANQKRSDKLSGRKTSDGMLGKSHRSGSKLKASESMRNRNQQNRIVCPHCGKEMANGGAYKRWHGDKCKELNTV